jgi:hypothetical protein
MDSFVTDTQALVKFMIGKKVINDPVIRDSRFVEILE